MPDVPISGLPTTPTPASGALLPVVDGSITKAITLAVAVIAGGALTAVDDVTLTKSSNIVAVKAGGISNAQVNVAAAIAGTKISPNFGSQSLVTTGTISLGTNPATSGDVRLAALGSVQFRNAANSGNVLGLSVGSSDEVRLGNTAAVGYQLSAAAHGFRIAGTDVVSVTATQLNATSLVVSTTGSYRAGTNPATSGAYNLANATDIRGRKVDGVTDAVLLRIDSSDTVSVGDVAATGYRMTSAGVHGFRVGGTDAVTISASIMTVPAGAVSIGATPATTAQLRLPSQGLIAARNAANSGNVFMLSTTAADIVTVGGTGAAGVNIEVGGTQHLVLSGTPGGSGVLRVAHNKTVISGLNNAGDNGRSLVRWGTTADELILGDVTFTTRVLSQALWLGNAADTWIEVNGTSDTVNMGFGGAAGATFGAGYAAIGTTPAASGTIRLPHASSIAGRNNANSADRNVLRWGVSATDVLNVGDANVATVVNGSSVQLTPGAGATAFEVALLATNREIVSLFRGAAITTTQMPALTGDGVAYIGHATTEPGTGATSLPASGHILWASAAGIRSKGPLGGFWDVAPNTRVHRQIFSGFIETTATTTATVLTIDTSSFGTNATIGIDLWGFQSDVIAQGAMRATITCKRASGVLSGVALQVNSFAGGVWSATSSGNNILVQVTPADSVNYRWDALATVHYSNLINTDA